MLHKPPSMKYPELSQKTLELYAEHLPDTPLPPNFQLCIIGRTPTSHSTLPSNFTRDNHTSFQAFYRAIIPLWLLTLQDEYRKYLLQALKDEERDGTYPFYLYKFGVRLKEDGKWDFFLTATEKNSWINRRYESVLENNNPFGGTRYVHSTGKDHKPWLRWKAQGYRKIKRAWGELRRHEIETRRSLMGMDFRGAGEGEEEYEEEEEEESGEEVVDLEEEQVEVEVVVQPRSVTPRRASPGRVNNGGIKKKRKPTAKSKRLTRPKYYWKKKRPLVIVVLDDDEDGDEDADVSVAEEDEDPDVEMDDGPFPGHNQVIQYQNLAPLIHQPPPQQLQLPQPNNINNINNSNLPPPPPGSDHRTFEECEAILLRWLEDMRTRVPDYILTQEDLERFFW